jgi:hypothetical protein
LAITHSAGSETTGAGATVTHTHTPGAGTVSGIAVLISHGTTFSDIITGVTYGGVAMTRQAAANSFDNGGEIGRTYIYTLVASIGAGAQSVVVSKSDATTTIHVVAVSMVTATGVAEVVTANQNGGDDVNEANPSVTLTLGGKTCMCYVIEYNGVNAPGSMTEFAGQTAIHDHDFGNFSSKASRLTTTTAVNPSMGYTVAINAFCMSAVAFAEVVSGTLFNSSVSGGLTPSGALFRTTTRPLTGGLTPAGVIVRTASRLLAGAITPSGVIVRSTARALIGALTPGAGTLTGTKVANKSLDGALTPTGALTSVLARILTGALTPGAGTLVRSTTRVLVGALTPVGTLLRSVSKILSGSLTPVGAVLKNTSRSLIGALTPSGIVRFGFFKTLSGANTPSGALDNTFIDGEPIVDSGKGWLNRPTKSTDPTDVT